MHTHFVHYITHFAANPALYEKWNKKQINKNIRVLFYKSDKIYSLENKKNGGLFVRNNNKVKKILQKGLQI